MTYDVAVVGGGIVGAATAFELGRAGARTLLVDRADPGRATDAGAGIVSAETAAIADPAFAALARAGADYYDELLPLLPADTGWDRCGLVLVATRDSDVPSWAEIAARAPGAREIDGAEARERCPALGEVVRALFHPHAARVDGRALAAALLAGARAHGVEVREGSVDGLAGIEALDARAVVVAGGAWSPALAGALGIDAPVLPIRGQIAHLDLPDTPGTGAWPMVQQVHGHYMVPWPGGRVVVGATVEDAGFAPTTTVAGVEEVMREAQRVLPGLAGAALRELRVGLRPWSTDGLPLLGVVADAPVTSTVVVAAGHGANGLMLGPLSGRIAADLALGRTPAADPAPFAPGRFSARA